MTLGMSDNSAGPRHGLGSKGRQLYSAGSKDG